MYLLPQPKKMEPGMGEFVLDHRTRLVQQRELSGDNDTGLQQLKEWIEKETGLQPMVLVGKATGGDVELRLAGSDGEQMSDQGYHLQITPERILIEGQTATGVFYGVQTLIQMIGQCGGSLPGLEIWDEPDFPARGYYFDQTRGRVQKLPELKKLADTMAHYKLNQLQLYVEHTYLFGGLSEMWRDETPLLAEEIMELDRYCRERHIELVPSLASFGHLYTLLSTKTYGHLCEMEDSWKQPFSFWDRMRHHTVDVTCEDSLALMKSMLEEYMHCFTSDKFNLCADETFDLGKGKSAGAAGEKGVHRLYIDYVKELCAFLVEKGKTPMFWGDILWGSPELIRELPPETICLNWGYAPDQREEETRKMAQAGAVQYVCPGVAGWNQWVNLVDDSYRNIRRMCGYGKKYQAIGVLNTDWGDFGHINQPEFSVPGLIMGAVMSWNLEAVPECEELEQQIARVEYRDDSERLILCMAQLPKCSLFQWREAELYYECHFLGQTLEPWEDLLRGLEMEQVEQCEKKLTALYREILGSMQKIRDPEKRRLQVWSVTIEGIRVWNRIGAYLRQEPDGSVSQEDAYALAAQLEEWFWKYKEIWRQQSKEGDLHHIGEVVFWYADVLRGRVEK